MAIFTEEERTALHEYGSPRRMKPKALDRRLKFAARAVIGKVLGFDPARGRQFPGGSQALIAAENKLARTMKSGVLTMLADIEANRLVDHEKAVAAGE